jgi:hypothetical protein
MNKALYLSGWMVGLAATGLGLTACSRAAEICDAICECELCSDRKYDECKIDVNRGIDEANAYDCGDLYQTYLDCTLDRAQCTERSYHLEQNDCDNEGLDYHNCVDAASDLDSSTTPVTICTCACECSILTNQPATCNASGCCVASCQGVCSTAATGTYVNALEQCVTTGG